MDQSESESQTIQPEVKEILGVLQQCDQREQSIIEEHRAKLHNFQRDFELFKDDLPAFPVYSLNYTLPKVDPPDHNKIALLEAKLSFKQRERRKQFKEYLQFRLPPQSDPKNIQSRPSLKNQVKIEKKLMEFFGKVFKHSRVDPLENYIYKKYTFNDEDVFYEGTYEFGVSAESFLTRDKDPSRFPLLGWEYDDNRESSKMLSNLQKGQVKSTFKAQDVQRSLKTGTFPSKKKQKKYDQSPIEHQITTQQEYIQSIFQQELLEEPLDYALLAVSENKVHTAWMTIIKNVQKIGRFKSKYRTDFRDFMKRLAYFCAKEVRKKFSRCQKQQKEYQVRAKKLSKETQSYWRKREKELIEIKKRKEKLEQERKKKEEEEKEQQLQKRRLEFLMKQSDIYAHFMAKKLGITNVGSISDDPNVDEKLAMERVARIIDETKASLQFYDGQKQMQQEVDTMKELKELTMDFSQVDTGSQLIKTPPTFKGDLKEYQLKGLRWLDNLYEQGINGILADEMGLGKTIQAIALLALISHHKNVWGPFLVIAPSSTLHNWQQELKKFCPSLRVLPYWGQAHQRKTIRRYFNQKNFGRQHSHFHVVVTSYNLVVSDNKVFHRLKWQYMILDEAQAIKNINSQRWTTLLSFNARNRLLLTGTPIQNTMGELWALLHFIMPKFFDSFDQFQEWFSKDIEAHSMDQKSLNQHQLQRLHAILKPFMLRRLKKDVEHEIGQKREVEIKCVMTNRQAALYNSIKGKLSIKEFFKILDSKAKLDNLMNLVMQFRKICNHPELFERRPYKSPYLLGDRSSVLVHQQQQGQIRSVQATHVNPLSYEISKLIWDELYSEPNRVPILIHNQEHITKSSQEKNGLYSFMNFLGLGAKYHSDLFSKNVLLSLVSFMHMMKVQRRIKLTNHSTKLNTLFWINKQLPIFKKKQLIEKDFNCVSSCITEIAIVRPIELVCSSQSFHRRYQRALHDPQMKNLFKQTLVDFILPSTSSQLISQSAKLRQLDKLLKELKSEHKRVLIFCQMTKMLDILEEYMLFKGYTYFRLDGQCQINDRRDMVNEYQTNEKIFAFLLSTRAGGLGITLTQADAVIFYDNDWNPTMDAQATDRAHRIGRTKDVWVYRLVTQGTIEERIVQRAQQKQNVQSTVYAGGVFQGDKFKPQEVMELLFDKSEIDANVTNKFMNKGSKKKKKTQPKKNGGIKDRKEPQETVLSEDDDVIEVNLDLLEKNELDAEDAD